jgi:hypothetical protein
MVEISNSCEFQGNSSGFHHISNQTPMDSKFNPYIIFANSKNSQVSINIKEVFKTY